MKKEDKQGLPSPAVSCGPLRVISIEPASYFTSYHKTPREISLLLLHSFQLDIWKDLPLPPIPLLLRTGPEGAGLLGGGPPLRGGGPLFIGRGPLEEPRTVAVRVN